MLLLLLTFLVIHFGIDRLEKYTKNAHKYPQFFDRVNMLTGLLLFFAISAILGNKWLLYSTRIDKNFSFKIDIKRLHLYHIPIFIPIHVGLSENMLAFHALLTFCVFIFIIYITHPRIYAHRYTHLPHEKRMSALLNEIRKILIRLFIMQILITIIPDVVLGIQSVIPKKILVFLVRFIFKFLLKYFFKYPVTRYFDFYYHFKYYEYSIYKKQIELAISIFNWIKTILYWLIIIALLIFQHGLRMRKTAFRLVQLKIIPYTSFWNLCAQYIIFPWTVVIIIYIIYGLISALIIGYIEYSTDPDYFFYCMKDFFLWIIYPGGDVPGDPGDPNNDHINRR